jgi:hypothetical protein
MNDVWVFFFFLGKEKKKNEQQLSIIEERIEMHSHVSRTEKKNFSCFSSF